MLDKKVLAHLQKGLVELRCELSFLQQDKLLQFLTLLKDWNRVHNLTAITDFKEMLSHHLLDSLSVLPYLTGNTLVDVGSGAGLPGIPLAIARPELKIVLLDSNQKKIHFLKHVIAMLSLPNVSALHQRAEEYVGMTFDMVISRAFSALDQFLLKTEHLCQDRGVWIAMKGKIPETELQSLPKTYTVSKLEEIKVPGLTHRCLIFIHRNH